MMLIQMMFQLLFLSSWNSDILLLKKNVKGKDQNKSLYVDDLNSFPYRTWMEEKFDPTIGNVGIPKIFKSNHFNSVN